MCNEKEEVIEKIFALSELWCASGLKSDASQFCNTAFQSLTYISTSLSSKELNQLPHIGWQRTALDSLSRDNSAFKLSLAQ